MTHLLCRSKVIDFAAWKAKFEAHAAVQREAGLRLERLWRSVEDPNEVFFLFEVRDIARALGYIDAPESEQAERASGVIEGEAHFIEDSGPGAHDQGAA
ncbi:MAG TPA: hypothetical protein VML57_11425 [Burkholderiales bacterium]|jgi:hypothetical protein|nr:hypothetical protein [Burkholderiales bacterium]